MNNKKTFDTYEYQLALGANIKNPTATVTALSFSPSKGTTVRIGDTDYTVTLQGVKFTRKIYEPGLIEAEVSMDAVPDVKDVNDVFTMRYAELTIVNKTEGVADDNRNTKIAKNYFVYMVNPQIVMNSDTPEMFVKLTIHSMDKLKTTARNWATAPSSYSPTWCSITRRSTTSWCAQPTAAASSCSSRTAPSGSDCQ